MKKKRIKIISVIAAVAVIAASLCVAGIALTIHDGLFSTNTPMYITPNGSVKGNVESEEDYEAFMLDITEPGALTVMLEHENLIDNTNAYDIKVYKILQGEENQYHEIEFFQSFWNSVTASWGEVGVSPGTYCIVVTSGTKLLRCEFNLITSFTKTSGFEEEPNDTRETANTLNAGKAKYAGSPKKTEGTDVDWYTFKLTKDSCVELLFNHDDQALPSAGWNIKLMDSEEKIICNLTSKLQDMETTSGILGLRAGTYYVRVESQSEVSKSYTVLLSKRAAGNCELELNDTPETATLLPCDTEISGALAEKLLSLDKDYYKFVVPEAGSVDFEFRHNPLEGDHDGWNIRLYKKNADGTLTSVVTKIAPWNTRGINIYNLGLEAGEYYALIDADGRMYTSEGYTCKWSLMPSSCFEKEPNNTRKTAENIKFNTIYHGAVISNDLGSVYDTDYFRFELTQQDNVSLELGHDKIFDSAVPWHISIVDEDNFVLYELESSLNQGLITTGAVSLPEGTYYVKITTGTNSSDIPYFFKLSGVERD